jgi:hypothetical protein
MTDQNLAKDLLQYTEWSGSRADLIALIERLEKAEPRARMLQSKKAPYALLPINARRIQWFITKGMMPKPLGHKYGYMHLVYYWASVVARKRERLQFQQIEGLVDEATLDGAFSYIAATKARLDQVKLGQDFAIGDETDETEVSLVSLGREEGRPLKSTLIRVAITPWCHVLITKKMCSELNEESINVLSKAFKSSLESLKD